MHRLPWAALAACVPLLPTIAFAQPPTLTLEEALERARAHAPAVLAARDAVDEARGRLVGASVLLRDNPELEGAAGARLLEDGTLLEGDFGLVQFFELGGQRGARTAGAQAGVAREIALAQDATRRVLRDTALAFFRLLYAEQRVRLATNGELITSEVLRVAERRYAAGDIAVLDVDLARAAAARARGDVQAQRAACEAPRAELRLLLGMDGSEPLTIRGSLNDRRHYELSQLVAGAPDRPDLHALAAEVHAADADIQLGRAARWPSVGVGARYERDDGNNVGLGNIVLRLPIFDRGQGVEAEALARRQRFAQGLEAGRRAADIEVRAAFAAYQYRERAVVELEANALPHLDENETLARRSYEAGELSLAELLAIRGEILQTRIDYADRLLEAAVAAVELEASAGVLK